MSDVAKLIENYRSLLNSFWEKAVEVSKHAGGRDWLNDWKEANWELIVEGELAFDSSVVLLPYGEGADYCGGSSRVFRPDALPTHAINCVSNEQVCDLLMKEPVAFPAGGFQLDSLVTMRDGWYYEEPPFDCVLVLIDDQQLVFSSGSVRFELRRLQSVMVQGK